MEDRIRKERKWFWAWQDEAEEGWLRKMSQEGWHLSKIEPLGTYTFKEGEPDDYIYRMDYQNKMKNELVDYYQIFSDAGWEHIGEVAGWHYFRKIYQADDTTEIFTDAESKIAKYQRLLLYLIFPIVLIINSIVILNRAGFFPLRIFLVPCLVLMLWAEYRIWRRIQELKRL